MVNNDAFQYEFTGKELVYYLFRKKVCPHCGGKLSKTKKHETVEGYKLNNKQDAFFIPDANVKRYHHLFFCQNCKTAYPISDLAK